MTLEWADADEIIANLRDNEAGMLAHIDDLEDTNKLLLEALKRWRKLYDVGYRRRGVGIGAVLIGKWDADEARFYTDAAIRKAEGKLP